MGARRAVHLLWLACVLLCACATLGQQCNKKDAFVVKTDMSTEALGQEVDKQNGAGYRMTSLTAYETTDGARFGATWVKPAGASAPQQQILIKLTSAELEQRLADTKDLCITSVTGYTDAGTDYYAALWDEPQGAGCAESDVRPALTHDAYVQQFNAWSGTHYPVWVQPYAGGSKVSAIFNKNGGGPDPGRGGWVTSDSMDAATFAADNDKWTSQGFRLVTLTGFRAPNLQNSNGYAAIWWKGGNGRASDVLYGLSTEAYQCQGSNMVYSGYVPLFINAYNDGQAVKYQAIYELQGIRAADLDAADQVVADYARRSNLPSLSVAIAKGGLLRFARSWGYADNRRTQLACPTSAYRLASVSKPMTATGIFKLIEQGKLALEDKVFGQGGVLGTKFGQQPYPRYVEDITIQNLLEHTSGIEWSYDVADPVFNPQHLNDNQAQVIGWVLNSVRLSKPPGGPYHYSNIGYMMLARVIEEVTGQGYEEWMREVVLRPVGANGMFLAASTLAGKRPNEVEYSHPQDPNSPYELNVGRMDGHGGWAGSALDVVRFALGNDGKRSLGNQPLPEVLSAREYNSMLTQSEGSQTYARGWNIRGTDHWHTGSIDGSNAEVAVVSNNDFAQAILTNTDTPDQSVLQLIYDIRSAIKVWPCDGFDM